MEHRPGQRVEPGAGIALPVDEAQQPLVQRGQGRAVLLGLPGELGHAAAIDVVTVVVQGDGHVERVASDDDVGGAGVQRHAVERGMGLDDTAVRLGGQAREDVLLGLDQPVQPGGQPAEAIGQLGPAEHQQETDHLDPGGARLRPGAHHDVAGAEGKVPPAGAVLVGRRVVPQGCRGTAGFSGSVTFPSHGTSIADGETVTPWPRQPHRTRRATAGQWPLRRFRARRCGVPAGGRGHWRRGA